MPKFLFCFVLFLVMFASCGKSDQTSGTFFDSLINTQTNRLAHAKARLTKTARMGMAEDEKTFTPAAADWEKELDVFRQLDAFSKPAYRSAYSVVDGQKDPASNLFIRSYRALQNVPVRELKFFYFREFSNLKRIEALYQEDNALFTGTRSMSLDFEEVAGVPELSGYRLDGMQKMMLTDSVLFSVQGSIRH